MASNNTERKAKCAVPIEASLEDAMEEGRMLS